MEFLIALTVSLEGLPGAGKTTAMTTLAKMLNASHGLRVGTVDIETTGHAPVLRKIASSYPLGHPMRVILFWSLRIQQYEAMIEFARSGDYDVVFADRYWGSTIAFDVFGNQVPQEVLGWVGQHIQVQPDMTLFFDVPIDVIRKRKDASTMNDDAFAARVEAGYKELAERLSWTQIDASLSPDQVIESCLSVILPQIEQRLRAG